MEFKSALEKQSEHLDALAKATLSSPEGVKAMKRAKRINDLVQKSSADDSMIKRSIYIIKTIQPSISFRDLKIASDLMCAMAMKLVLTLESEGLVTLNE